MEKQKKKLTISGKPKKDFVSQKNFENRKKFSKPLNKISNNFKKTFKPKPIASKLSDYERRKLAEQKAMKGIRGENSQKDKDNKSKFTTKKRETKFTQKLLKGVLMEIYPRKSNQNSFFQFFFAK